MFKRKYLSDHLPGAKHKKKKHNKINHYNIKVRPLPYLPYLPSSIYKSTPLGKTDSKPVITTPSPLATWPTYTNVQTI